MFSTLVLIGVPVLFLIVGTLAALSFARSPGEETVQADVVRERILLAVQPNSSLFAPSGNAGREIRELSLEELVAAVEEHVRQERQAAQEFSRNPSMRTLWLN
ncbi:hypothetical protein K8I61_10180 [bacterium]|nr:hypothetical protein [bacterium]